MKKKGAEPSSQNGHAHIGENVLTNGCCDDSSDVIAEGGTRGENFQTKNTSSKADFLTAQLSDLSVDDNDAKETLNQVSLDDAKSSALSEEEGIAVEYSVYQNELQMPDIMRLIQKDLSEPYSIYTYRYFIHNWPHLCFMVC